MGLQQSLAGILRKNSNAGYTFQVPSRAITVALQYLTQCATQALQAVLSS